MGAEERGSHPVGGDVEGLLAAVPDLPHDEVAHGRTVPSGTVGRRATSATSSSIGCQLRESAVAVISE